MFTQFIAGQHDFDVLLRIVQTESPIHDSQVQPLRRTYIQNNDLSYSEVQIPTAIYSFQQKNALFYREIQLFRSILQETAGNCTRG